MAERLREGRLTEEHLELCMPSERKVRSGDEPEQSDEVKAFMKGWILSLEDAVFEMT